MWISPNQLAELAGISYRKAAAAMKRSKAGARWRGATLNVRQARGRGGAGGVGYEVHVDSLPVALQARWHAQRAAPAHTDTSGPGGRQEPRRPWTQEEREARHAAFTRQPSSIQAAACKKLQALHSVRLYRAAGASAVESHQRAAREAGVTTSTLYEWAARCKGLDPGDWIVALAPGHPGSREGAVIPREAFDWIKSEYLQLTKPALAPIYRRAQKEARKRSLTLPSYATVKRRIEEEIPRWLLVKMREGEEAYERMFSTMARRYGELELHEEWCADGRKADVWVRWEDGSISRPIIVGWIDMRSRLFLGYVLWRVESADAIRIAWKRSLELANVIPKRALLDNGRGFASKLMSGGSPNRYRFKVKEEELPGILTLQGVEINWAPPRLGRVKPIESFWRTLGHLDKQFPGAYVGASPEERPADCDPSKAVPIAQYRAALEEALRDYNEKPHRGDAMDGRSPREVYEELLPITVVRQPTREQIRLCNLCAQKLRLDRRDSCVTLFGNRYKDPASKLDELPEGALVDVRFDPEDLTQPVSVYRHGELICDALLVHRGGFRDQQSAKDHKRAQQKLKKARADEIAALAQMRKTRGGWMTVPEPKNAPDAGAVALPLPKIAEPLRPLVDYRIKPNEPKRVSAEEVRRAAALAQQMQRKTGTR